MVYAGLVAGGSGSRMQSDIPKQFLPLLGKPILAHTLAVFLCAEDIDGIVIGVPGEYRELTEEIVRKTKEEFDCQKRVTVCEGGATRNETLFRMMKTAQTEFGAVSSDIFVTHDAVRPFVTGEMIEANIREAAHADAVTTAVPATDTLLFSTDGRRVDSVPKRNLAFHAQTPQTAHFALFTRIAELPPSADGEPTDLCGLCERLGVKAVIVPGSPENIKITGPTDMPIAEAILRDRRE